MINLLISFSPDKWDKSPAFIEPERALTEYIMSTFHDRFATLTPQAIDELKATPCLFAYEKVHKKDIAVGRITNIIPQQTNIRIDFELTGQIIPFECIDDISDVLDMGAWEWNRTHWTVKNANLSDLDPYFANVDQRKPVVFVSYCWSPPSNQRNVFELIQKLEKDGITVKYDKGSLRPGQDMNYFMEQQLLSKECDSVIIVCNSDYAAKANARSGGVGYESGLILTQIRNDPMQTRYIPVAIEHNDDGTLPLPTFLQSRYCIDLTAENGYEGLLESIKKCCADNCT